MLVENSMVKQKNSIHLQAEVHVKKVFQILIQYMYVYKRFVIVCSQ